MADCDHEDEWCSLVAGVCAKIHPCLNCLPNEPPARCDARWDAMLYAFQQEFPENCTGC